MTSTRSEQEIIRREKLKELRNKEYPYPNDTHVDSTCSEVVACAGTEAQKEAADRRKMTLGGRIITIRLMGKASFCHIQDRSGKVQVYVRQDEVGPEAFAAFKNFDMGDVIEIHGYPFITKTGEPSLHALSVRLLVKCLHPLPEKWHGLQDIETRYRQRYLDLIVNPKTRDAFRLRSRIIAEIRKYFDERDYLEVETPMMSSISGGATARPFITHHNALDLRLNLRIALELPLKRLVVGGLERVYEIGRVFRNEGLSTEHNPEFTMLEFYEAYATYETMMDITEELLLRLCDNVVGSRKVEFDGKEVDFTSPWRRLTMLESVHEIGGVSREFDLNTIEGVRAAVRSLGLDLGEKDPEWFDYGKLLYEIFDKHVESKIISPTFITKHPLSVSPLARPSMDDPRFVDRFELFMAGLEVANAFSELNDPEDQEERFRSQLEAKARGDEEAMDMDEDFVRALEYGLPPTGGEGIGIDRLVMILSGQPSIRDVILFPQMRPSENK